MRIESGYPIQGSDDIERAKKKPVQPGSASSDGVTSALSKDSVRLRSLEARANATAEVRPDRVASLKQSIADGTYEVSNPAVADAILKDVLRR
jgi:flagellar biosynthesis anti-sigma factor FlgM